jgi:hypothetical protein
MMVALREGDSDTAQTALELVLMQGSPEMKGKCLFYQGLISEEKGNAAAARQNWTRALEYASEGSFLRYQLELNLGSTSEQQAGCDEALDWLRKALETCCRGDEFAGIRALTGYLKLNGGRIRSEDESLIACVCVKSWRVLELAGEPDANDWSATATRLADELERRVGAIVNEQD